MSNGTFRLLERFRRTFEGRVYRHRSSALGNKIGRELFEDILVHADSERYVHHVQHDRGVAHRGGKIHVPKLMRRNDSIFGKPPAGVQVRTAPIGFRIPEGPVAEPRVGCEVKILAKSQQKQIDRVIKDLKGFASDMKRLNRQCINVAIIGINHESN